MGEWGGSDIIYRTWAAGQTYGFSLVCVPEHQPCSDNGHRSVTLMTMLFVAVGKNGGVGMYVFNSVRTKHLPQPGP